MSASIYIKLANFFIKLDDRRNEKKAKKIRIENYAHLSDHMLKDIGLTELASQRDLSRNALSGQVDDFSSPKYLTRHDYFR